MIVRHGQASFGAENYDQLSNLGVRQAETLGSYLRSIGWVPDRLITGSLARQIQTLEALGFEGVREEHTGFNEYDLDGSRKSELNRVASDGDRKTYFRGLRDLVLEWQRDAELGTEESWQNFCDRTEGAMSFATKTEARRVLVVSSGGVIGQVVRAVLQAPPPMMMELNLQVRNSSFTRLVFSSQRRMLHVFNAAPHLDAAPDLTSYA